ncbi:hypothetical protein Tco_1178622, partial [Tanacetum coccineum]
LEDNGGVATLPNSEISEQLALMGNMKRISKGYSGVDIPLFPTTISAPETSPSRITSSLSLSPQHTPVSTPQAPNTQPIPDAEEAVLMPHESPLHSVHSLGRDEGSLSLSELTVLCINFSNKVTSLEAEMAQTKQTYGTALTKLIKKVKKLERTVKSTQARRRFRIVVSDDEEGTSWIQEDIDIQEKVSDDTEVVLEEEEPTELVEDQGSVEKGEKEVSTAAANLERQRTARDAEIAKQLQEEINKATQEQEKQEVVTEADPTHVIDWSDPAMLRYHAQLNRPYFIAEVRKNMVMYLKNQGGYKMNYFKGMKYEDIRPIFEKVWDQIQSFAHMDSEKEKGSVKKGSRKKSLVRKRSREKQSEESSKRQKIEDDIEKEELKAYLDLVLREEFAMEIEYLDTKYPIVDWKTHVLTKNFMYYQIIITDGEDEVWRHQHEYNLISWRLFDSCGIHILLMDNGIAIHMMIEKKYLLTQEMLSKMLSRKLEVDHENEIAFELLRFIRSQVQK